MKEQMYVFALDCYPDANADPSVVMIIAARSETDAVELAFEHPNASQYRAVQINPKSVKQLRSVSLERGVHGFVNWKAYKAL